MKNSKQNNKVAAISRRQLISRAGAILAGLIILPGRLRGSKRKDNSEINPGLSTNRNGKKRKKFLDENFLLESDTAVILYHNHAKKQPIIDYHNHLPPHEIAADKQFENPAQIWLSGDHYKYRAMRAYGINEEYITGTAPDRDKFIKWAETVPYTMRNPLYHWTHLELQRYFGINKLLNPDSAVDIYEEMTEKLQTPEYSVHNLLRKMNVEVVCTTDDPVDSLEHHRKVKEDGFEIKVLPAWRPDKFLMVENTDEFNKLLDNLSEVSDIDIISFSSIKEALRIRHDFFAENYCKLSDYGMETIYAEGFTKIEIEKIFNKARNKKELSEEDILKFKSAMLYEFGLMDHEKNWVQQFHIGPLRDNNTRLLKQLGPDTGFDSIGDLKQAHSLSKHLDRLDRDKRLAKTIIYNLNPSDNEVFATMIGNYQDGSIPGKIQFGSAWWFLDQKDGMEKQMNALSNMGLLSMFIGMLTDSRSFLSFPRHEYFRRILCNLLGNDVENGELPDDIEFLGKMVENICYYNAREYFKFESSK